jgi:lipid A 3-O-deacylase
MTVPLRSLGTLGLLFVLATTAADAQTRPRLPAPAEPPPADAPAVIQVPDVPPLGTPAPVVEVPDRRGTFSFTLENDALAGTDKNYTNGFQFDWRSSSYDQPQWMAAITNRLSLLFPQGGTTRWGASFGQAIFTPADTERRNPDPRDRPYAGWLYGSVSLASYTASSMGSVELQMGIVGPGALGEQVQNGFHRLAGFRLAEGWDHQLKDEFGINVIANRQWRWNYDVGSTGLQYGFVPSLTGSLGTVYTYAAAGMLVRFGSNLNADFGPPRTRPGQTGSNFFQPENSGFGWYVFAGTEGRAIARNIFLDGNSFGNGPHVHRDPFVADFTAGAAIMFNRVRVTASYTYRTREFDTQQGNSQYGSISVAFRF